MSAPRYPDPPPSLVDRLIEGFWTLAGVILFVVLVGGLFATWLGVGS